MQVFLNPGKLVPTKINESIVFELMFGVLFNKFDVLTAQQRKHI